MPVRVHKRYVQHLYGVDRVTTACGQSYDIEIEDEFDHEKANSWKKVNCAKCLSVKKEPNE